MGGEDDRLDLRGALWMLGSVMLFAANTLLIRAAALASGDADGWMATLFRGFFGILILVIFFSKGRGFEWRRMFSNRLVVMRGLVGGVAIICFYITIDKLGAGRAIVINLTYPLFATVIAAIWLKESVRVVTGCWLVVATVGLVVFLSDERMRLAPTGYDMVGLLGAFLAGWVVVIIRKLRHAEHPATIYGAQASCSLLLGLPFIGEVPEMDLGATGFLAAGAIVVTFGQLLMTSAYQRLSIAHGASLQMVLPIVTSVGAFFFFGETFQSHEFIGAVIVLVGIWRVASRRKFPVTRN